MAAAILGVAAVSVGVSRLKPAAPTVERGTVWTDTVKRGTMLRQVQGVGTPVRSQEEERQIPAERALQVAATSRDGMRAPQACAIVLPNALPEIPHPDQCRPNPNDGELQNSATSEHRVQDERNGDQRKTNRTH